MSASGYMNFFKIDRCGLYRSGNEKTYGCEVTETFDLLSSWLKGRPFSSTIPWDPQKARLNKPSAYCRDIIKDNETGDFFVVLWKSDPSGVEGLWGVPEDDKNGSAQVVRHNGKHRGKRIIWGRPCYYWVIPEYNTVVSIKFTHSVCDAQLFQDYVTACITNRVKHPNRVREHTKHGYTRIIASDSTDIKYRYSFSISLKVMETSSISLDDLSKKITHIVKRETVKVDSKDARAEWVKKFNDYIPYVPVRSRSKSRKIEVRAEANPTVHEIKEIIEKSAYNDQSRNKWDNVGFETDDGMVWVDSYRLKDSITIVNHGDDVMSAETLSKKIKSDRFRYVKKLVPEAAQRSASGG